MINNHEIRGNKTKHNNSEAVTNMINGIGKIFSTISSIIFLGVKKSPWKNKWFWCYSVLYGIMISCLAIGSNHLKLLQKVDSDIFTNHLVSLIASKGLFFNFSGLFSFYWIVIFFIIGMAPYSKLKRMQKNFEPLGLRNSLGNRPKVIDVTQPMVQKTRVLVKTNGIGVDSFEKSKSAIASAFDSEIEKISTIAGKPSLVELILTQKVLPSMCHYKDMKKHIKKPCSFVVGEGQSGILTQDITSLPHLLIAGTTGGGKSVFFKNALCGLLESSPNLQMYLLDLKGGVEMKKFEEFKNVSVACDIDTALDYLKVVKNEMDKRYQILRHEGLENIDTTKFDRIIVGVDEASILYQTNGRGSSDYESIIEARAITDKIAKLGRAAGIHLILATQKVTKETISTSIQECVTGRMCFRMNTVQGSSVVLGRKDAMELPDVEGRALWQRGLILEEVQAPYISKEEISEIAKKVNHEFEEGKKKLAQRMIITSEVISKSPDSSSIRKNADND